MPTLSAASYRERPNPRDGLVHFNRQLFALKNIFFEYMVLDVPSALTHAPHGLVINAFALGAISPGHLDGTLGTAP